MSTLLDNRGQGKVGDPFAEGIQANARLSILSGLFSIYGYCCLKKHLARVGGLRLLIPSNDTPAGSGNERPFRMAGLAGSETDRRFRNSLFKASDFYTQPNMTLASGRRMLNLLQEKGFFREIRPASGRRSAILAYRELLSYRRRWEKKPAWYKANEISSHEDGGGENGTLIIARESARGGISSQEIEQIIRKVVLV